MAGTAVTRRKAAGFAMVQGDSAMAARILASAPDPQIGEAAARRIVKAFKDGGFTEARVDIRGYDFEPMKHTDLRKLRMMARRWFVTMEDRGAGGLWLVRQKDPDLSDYYTI